MEGVFYILLPEEQFNDTILEQSSSYCFVVFTNDTYASHLLYDSIIEEVASEMCESCSFYRMSNNSSMFQRLGILNIPSALLYHNGEIIGHIKGIQPKRYVKEYISSLII